MERNPEKGVESTMVGVDASLEASAVRGGRGSGNGVSGEGARARHRQAPGSTRSAGAWQVALAGVLLLAVAEGATSSEALNLIPRPKILRQVEGCLPLTPASRVVAADPGLQPLAAILSGEIYLATGLRLQTAAGGGEAGDIVLKLNPTLRADDDILSVQQQKLVRVRDYAHALNIDRQAVVEGFDYRAVAEGTATLLQALRMKGDAVELPRLSVKDWPHADFLGVMVDVGRQEIPLATLEQTVEACRIYKVRYLHLHLSEDQGWTFPSAAFPALGTKNTAAHGGIPPKVYDRAALQKLVAFAEARGVTAVPEIDLPGHSGAMRRAMPALFAAIGADGKPVDLPMIHIGKAETYAALDTLIGEVCEVFDKSPYFHIGGDETTMGRLLELPETQSFMEKNGLKSEKELFHFFMRQMNGMVRKHGKVAIIWEGAGNFASDDIIHMPWASMNRTAAKFTARGIPVITVPWTYSVQWPEWNIYVCNGDKLKRTDPVLGGMVPFWEMSADALISRYLPRIPDRQERSWGPDNTFTEEEFAIRRKATESLVARLIAPVQIRAAGLFDLKTGTATDAGNEFDKRLTLTLEGIIKEGVIRYSTDGRAPTADSATYQAPLTFDADVVLRAGLFASDGNRIGHASQGRFTRVNYEKNLTTGKPVTCSGGTQGDNKPENAVDGAVSLPKAWWALPGPQWLKVDLQGEYTLGKAAVFPFWDGQRSYRYTVEVSLDDQTWTQVVDMSTNTKPSTPAGETHVFKPTAARYVRITLLGGSAWPLAKPVHLVEFRVYEDT